MDRDHLGGLEGLRICISGASRGLGLRIARAFAVRGACVVINSHDKEELTAAQETLGRDDLEVTSIVADVSSAEACRALIDEATNRMEGLDCLICNAAIDVICPAVDVDDDEWRRILSVNLDGYFFAAQAAGRVMADRGGGSIILTSSIAGRAGVPGLVAYSAAKAGGEQLVRSLAVEWAPLGIRVNAVAPGYIDNFMEGVDSNPDSDYQRRALARTPMARRGRLDEFVGAYLFLAGPSSTYVTGSTLYVDGGYTAG